MSRVAAVSFRSGHHFSKTPSFGVQLLAGLGVAGDAHMGVTVKHRSRVRKDPTQPNLRQVHLMHAELFRELRAKGFAVRPGELGENITTSGIDLLALPSGTRLHLGASAVVEITGLRNPCIQIDRFQDGLMAATLDKDADGRLVRKAGIMSIVIADGYVGPGDAIHIQLPDQPHRPLEPV
jgi:MOSC domain-containing protein YiiM